MFIKYSNNAAGIMVTIDINKLDALWVEFYGERSILKARRVLPYR